MANEMGLRIVVSLDSVKYDEGKAIGKGKASGHSIEMILMQVGTYHGVQYTDEMVRDFVKQLNEKNNDWSDSEKWEMTGRDLMLARMLEKGTPQNKELKKECAALWSWESAAEKLVEVMQ